MMKPFHMRKTITSPNSISTDSITPDREHIDLSKSGDDDNSTESKSGDNGNQQRV